MPSNLLYISYRAKPHWQNAPRLNSPSINFAMMFKWLKQNHRGVPPRLQLNPLITLNRNKQIKPTHIKHPLSYVSSQFIFVMSLWDRRRKCKKDASKTRVSDYLLVTNISRLINLIPYKLFTTNCEEANPSQWKAFFVPIRNGGTGRTVKDALILLLKRVMCEW